MFFIRKATQAIRKNPPSFSFLEVDGWAEVPPNFTLNALIWHRGAWWPSVPLIEHAMSTAHRHQRAWRTVSLPYDGYDLTHRNWVWTSTASLPAVDLRAATSRPRRPPSSGLMPRRTRGKAPYPTHWCSSTRSTITDPRVTAMSEWRATGRLFPPCIGFMSACRPPLSSWVRRIG